MNGERTGEESIKKTHPPAISSLRLSLPFMCWVNTGDSYTQLVRNFYFGPLVFHECSHSYDGLSILVVKYLLREVEKMPLLTATLDERNTASHIKFASYEMNER